MKNTNPQIFRYTLEVVYAKGYFNDPKTPLNKTLSYASTSPRTIEHMQRVYENCTIISANLLNNIIA